MAIRPMGTRYHGPLPDGNETAEVSGSWHRLLHQVDRSRSSSHYHKEEHLKLCMEEYHLQVWDTKSTRLRQWKTIRQQCIQGLCMEEYHLQVRDTKSTRLRQWKTIQQQCIQGLLLRARY